LTKLWERRGNKTSEELAAALFVETVISARHWSQSVGHILNAILPGEGELHTKMNAADVKTFASQVFGEF